MLIYMQFRRAIKVRQHGQGEHVLPLPLCQLSMPTRPLADCGSVGSTTMVKHLNLYDRVNPVLAP